MKALTPNLTSPPLRPMWAISLPGTLARGARLGARESVRHGGEAMKSPHRDRVADLLIIELVALILYLIVYLAWFAALLWPIKQAFDSIFPA